MNFIFELGSPFPVFFTEIILILISNPKLCKNKFRMVISFLFLYSNRFLLNIHGNSRIKFNPPHIFLLFLSPNRHLIWTSGWLSYFWFLILFRSLFPYVLDCHTNCICEVYIVKIGQSAKYCRARIQLDINGHSFTRNPIGTIALIRFLLIHWTIALDVQIYVFISIIFKCNFITWFYLSENSLTDVKLTKFSKTIQNSRQFKWSLVMSEKSESSKQYWYWKCMSSGLHCAL